MSCDVSEQFASNDSEAEAILKSLDALREQVLTAWRERAVILSTEEQQRLRKEIHKTCEMLTTVTRVA